MADSIFMKILFLKDYLKVGKIGEIKEVSQGFARNFLIPQKIATLLQSPEAELFLGKLKKKTHKKEAKRKEDGKIADLLRSRTWIIRANANEKGHLFALLHEKDLLKVFSHEGIQIDARQIEIPEPIKSLGNFFILFKALNGSKEKIYISVLPREKS